MTQQTIINRNDFKTMSAANYSHHRPMQDIHHTDIGPPIDSVIEFGSFAIRPTRRADAGKRIGTMEVLLRGASFELGGMKHRSPRYWGLIGGFGF